jgi:hypothetical protein
MLRSFSCAALPASGLYYKHTTIANYASRIVIKLEALLTNDARVVIYDRHVFIVQATGVNFINILMHGFFVRMTNCHAQVAICCTPKNASKIFCTTSKNFV